MQDSEHTSPDTAFKVLEATWPPASCQTVNGWTIRQGLGGGSRVSAATGSGDIREAEAAMRALGQRPLFMIRPENEALDRALEAAGYAIKDPVVIYEAKAEQIARHDAPELAGIPSDAPLAVQREIWKAGGIGDERLAVMARAKGPKTYLLLRASGRPVGTGFVACEGETAMLHALEVQADYRGNGFGRTATIAAARWASDQNTTTIMVVCTKANVAANALYQSLSMKSVTNYHYRISQTA